MKDDWRERGERKRREREIDTEGRELVRRGMEGGWMGREGDWGIRVRK